MNIGKEVLFFFSALGAFNGFVLALFLIFFTRKKYLVNYLLGALLLAMSIRIGKSVFLYFDGRLPKIYLQIGLSACFFIGPFLYFFVRSAMKPLAVLPRAWGIVLAALLVSILAVGIAYPYETYPAIWRKYITRAIYIEWFLFIAASGYVIRDLLTKALDPKYTLRPSETWITMIFGGNVVIFAFYFFSMVNAPFASYISGAIAFSLILYLICTLIVYRRNTDDLFLFAPVKTVSKKFSEDDAGIWLAKLDKAMREKQLFRNADLKLHDLSREIQVSAHQLSALLNEHLDKNFTTYINEFRIEAACRMMATDQRLTLEAIGYEVGFNSKSTFFAAFKKIRGVTPSAYQQTVNQSITI